MRRIKLHSSEEEAIARLFKEGYSVRQIAFEFLKASSYMIHEVELRVQHVIRKFVKT